MIKRNRPNIPIALASLFGAILLWFIVFNQSVRTSVRAFTWQLRPTGLAEDKYAITDMPANFIATVQGTDEQFRRFQNKELVAVVDLSRAGIGSRAYPVKVYPAEMNDLINAKDLMVNIEIEKLAKKEVPVKIDTTGEMADDMAKLQSLVASPTRVTVLGPASTIGDVTEARGFLDLGSMDTSSGQAFSVALEAINKGRRQVPNMRTEPLFASVSVTLDAAPEERQVLVIAKIVGAVPLGYALRDYRLEPTQLTVRGPSLTLASMNKISTLPINVNGLTESRSLSIGLQLPPGVRVKGLAQVKVNLVVEKIDITATNQEPN